MAIRKAKALWNGTLKEGKGEMEFSNYSGPYTYKSRFEEGDGTNPEELVAAAHGGCYSMFLSALLTEEGFIPESIETSVSVKLGKDEIGPCITKINLNSKVVCEGISQDRFKELAETAKEKCPISRLYNGGTAVIELNAELL